MYHVPPGAKCKRANNTDARKWMQPKNGYWETPSTWEVPLDDTYVKCTNPTLCTPDGCIKGTAGVICELCAKGYGKQFGQCMECSNSSIVIFSFAILFGLMLLFLVVYWIRKKLKSRKYFTAWKQVIAVLKVNIDFMQINSALPSVLAIALPENFVQFLKVFDFINVDFLSMTGATCAGATFMVRFSAMSALPMIAILIGLM